MMSIFVNSIGLKLKVVEKMLRWNSERCVAEKAELPNWWMSKTKEQTIYDTAQSLLNVGKSEISDCLRFDDLIDQRMKHKIYQLKCEIFNNDPENFEGTPIPRNELDRIRKARASANPFEQIGKSCFINRAAVKLASIDAALGFVLSENNRQTRESGQLLFADLCGGPGGFSEYLIWRLSGGPNMLAIKQNRVKGFGLTLRSKHDDFQQDRWSSLQKRMRLGDKLPFTALYGPFSNESNGDITSAQNRRYFVENVRREAPNGCGLVLGDGGFDMSGKEQRQEHLISKLLAYEFVLALQLLATGGNFVCKLFDVFNPVTGILLYVLSTFFEQLTVLKPCTSRPANSERYVVGLNFLSVGRDIVQTMTDAITQAADALNTDSGQVDYLPFMRFIQPRAVPCEFVNFLRGLNTEIASRQIAALEDLLDEARDPRNERWKRSDSHRETIMQMADECSRRWSLPPSSACSDFGSSSSDSLTSKSDSSNFSFNKFQGLAIASDNWRGNRSQSAQFGTNIQNNKYGGANPFSKGTNDKFFLNGANGSGAKNNGWKRGVADSVSNWRQSSA